ncbi:MAG: hypothetical protein WAV76_01885 [Bacteroidota bacterium]
MEAKNNMIHFSILNEDAHFRLFAFHSIFYYAHFRKVSHDQTLWMQALALYKEAVVLCSTYID